MTCDSVRQTPAKGPLPNFSAGRASSSSMSVVGGGGGPLNASMPAYRRKTREQSKSCPDG